MSKIMDLKSAKNIIKSGTSNLKFTLQAARVLADALEASERREKKLEDALRDIRHKCSQSLLTDEHEGDFRERIDDVLGICRLNLAAQPKEHADA